MKKIIITFVILCGVIACAVIFLNRQNSTPPAPAPIVEASPSEMPSPDKVVVPTNAPQPAISQNPAGAAPVSVQTPIMTEAKDNASTNAIGKLVDALLSAKNAGQKHEMFEQLRKSGQLKEVIAELQQRMSQNPNDVEIPTTLGEAQLNEVRAIKESGADTDQMGILAMQADQNFNAALKIDPQNWEANFVKASSMYYWPAEPTRDADVVQRLSGLIDQQETMASQPEFAQTYVLLGNEYQKIGQADQAAATWQLGLTKFPNDPTLQKKISGP
jgi:tetratricopeptide (TPR) repeat protein